MTLTQKFCNFLNAIFFRLTGKAIGSNSNQLSLPDLSEQQELLAEEEKGEDFEEKINVVQRTLMSRLYKMEQEIAVFEDDFPAEYNEFYQRIESLRASYNTSLEELQKLLTFEIDPESNTSKISEVVKLEHEIRKFIDSTVKFHVITKRLERLIKKLNILYNVSLSHSKESDKEKVRIQLEYIIQAEKKVVDDFKNSHHILMDKQLKERVIELLSYLDYEVFKCSIRNSSQMPRDIISRLALSECFEDFDYASSFTAFIKDELSDLIELLPLIDDVQEKILKGKSENLVLEITYSVNSEEKFLEVDFWSKFLEFESTLIQTMKISNVEKEKTTIKIIDRMNVKVEENEVLTQPIAIAINALTSIFATTQDNRILLLIKFLKNLSKEITYREIYFLLILFDIIGIIENTPNDLISHIKKYLSLCPYNKKDIEEKKQKVFDVPNKEYVVAFVLDNYMDETVRDLKSLKFDFKIENGKVFVNSFYFKGEGLENLLSSLKNNTINA